MTVENDTGRLLGKIALADDFTALLMFETLLDQLTRLPFDPDAVEFAFPAKALGVDLGEIKAWIDDPRLAEASAESSNAVTAARQILVAACDVVALRALVSFSVETPIDRKLKAGLSLKIGGIAAALMLVASTGFDVNYGGVKVHKEPLTAETINALANLVRSVRGDLPVSSTKALDKP